MRKENLKLREFSLSDLTQVMEIEKASFPKSRAYPKSYFEKYYQKYPQGFVVTENQEEIAGYAIGQLENGVGKIISLAVSPLRRQKGTGTLLAKFLIEHFKKKGAKEVSLHARIENEEGISFYRNLGFKIIKTVKNYYQNGDDAYLMIKEI